MGFSTKTVDKSGGFLGEAASRRHSHGAWPGLCGFHATHPAAFESITYDRRLGFATPGLLRQRLSIRPFRDVRKIEFCQGDPARKVGKDRATLAKPASGGRITLFSTVSGDNTVDIMGRSVFRRVTLDSAHFSWGTKTPFYR